MEEAMELVFIPTPAMGHLVSAVGTAKLLLQTRQNLSITFLIMKLPFSPPNTKINTYIDALLAEDDSSRLKLIQLPEDPDALKGHTIATIFDAFYDSQKVKVREWVNEIKNLGCVRLAGFVVDTLCLPIMDVADEFGLPTYVYFSSGAAFLGLLFHLQCLRDDQGKDLTELNDSDDQLNISTYSKPLPAKLLPKAALLKTGGGLDPIKRIREAKGIIANTFLELEPYALQSLANNNKAPPVYPLGPILNLKSSDDQKNQESEKEILKWLDDQPASSVVFLCFGSGGAFAEPQVKEIAYALERSGQRFLWALRKPPSPTSPLNPTDYDNLEEVLPEGFLDKTISVGKIIGWAPQAAVLAHPSVGGFVSHCGWNSILESIWFGVPIATWPMHSDQPANAFQLITEIGMAVEIKMNHISEGAPEKVNAEKIEIAIKSLMDQSATNLVRKKAKEVKEMSRKALEEGGSTFNFVESFFENIMDNLKLSNCI